MSTMLSNQEGDKVDVIFRSTVIQENADCLECGRSRANLRNTQRWVPMREDQQLATRWQHD